MARSRKPGTEALELGRFLPYVLVVTAESVSRLFSTTYDRRFGLSVPEWRVLAYLADGLWLRLAERSNALAADLARGLAALPGARILHPVEANMIFAAWPRSRHRAARAAGARYYFWPGERSLEGDGDEPLAARLVCGWSTTAEEVAALLAVLQGQEAAEGA